MPERVSAFESQPKVNQEIHGLLTGHLPNFQQNVACGKDCELVKIKHKSHNLHQSGIQDRDEAITPEMYVDFLNDTGSSQTCKLVQREGRGLVGVKGWGGISS